jgi:hypothetical protein
MLNPPLYCDGVRLEHGVNYDGPPVQVFDDAPWILDYDDDHDGDSLRNAILRRNESRNEVEGGEEDKFRRQGVEEDIDDNENEYTETAVEKARPGKKIHSGVAPLEDKEMK